MRKSVFLAIFCSIFFAVSYAQSDCEWYLKRAQRYQNEKKYSKAVEAYNEVLEYCSKYVNVEKVKAELGKCQEQLSKSQNAASQKKPSNGYVSQKQHATGWITYFGTYYGANFVMEFDADGICENPNVSVTCKSDEWFVSVSDDAKDWLSVDEYQNSFVVKCNSNQNRSERNGTISFVYNANDGSQTDMINVKQEARGSLSKRTLRTDYNNRDQLEEDMSITVKVIFEKGKAVPTFENVGKLLGLLEDDKNLGLQIEISWCSEQKIEMGIFNKYPSRLMKKRIKNITNYFVNSGIAKERIAWSINESNTDCDSGYVKLKDLNGESSK